MKILLVFKSAFVNFIDDEAMTLAAALAFYTILSLSPLLVVLLAVGGLLGHETQSRMVAQIQAIIGPQASQMVDILVRNAQQHHTAGVVSAVIGIATILFSASGLFGQLQFSLNKIWRVQESGSGMVSMLKKRLVSLAMVFAIAILLLASLAVSAVLNFILPSGQVRWEYLDIGLSISIFTLLFAISFKFLPDLNIRWRVVWPGAFITAVLFALGKHGIGLYLGHSSVASAYGAAGSLILLLLWIYYSSIILFFGAELTQAYSSAVKEQ